MASRNAGSSEQLAILVQFEQHAWGSDIYQITTAEVTTIKDGKPDYYPGEYRHLYVRGQQDNHGNGHCYGYRVSFRAVDDVDLRDAERYYRVLKSVEGKLLRLSERLGPVYSYSEYVARLCYVLGIKTAIFDDGRQQYTQTSIKDAIYRINETQQEWAIAHCNSAIA